MENTKYVVFPVHHMILVVQERSPFHTLLGNLIGQAKQNASMFSSGQPHFCSANTTATLKADQILLRLEYMTTPEHKFKQKVSNHALCTSTHFLEEVQGLADDAFPSAAQTVVREIIYTKLAPRLKKSTIPAHLGDRLVKVVENSIGSKN